MMNKAQARRELNRTQIASVMKMAVESGLWPEDVHVLPTPFKSIRLRLSSCAHTPSLCRLRCLPAISPSLPYLPLRLDLAKA